MIAYMTLFTALTLVGWKLVQQYAGAKAIWMLPLFWFAFDWLRGWLITGMPWLSLGYSQTLSPLAGFAPLVGVYGIGALCILMAVALIVAVSERRYPILALKLAVILVIPLSGWLLQQLEWSEPVAQPLKVTMVQGNIPQELKWRRDQRQNIFNTYWRETGRHWDSDLIIWPETALPGHSRDIETSLLAPMQAAALENDSAIISGLVFAGQAQNQFYNSVIQLGREPRVVLIVDLDHDAFVWRLWATQQALNGVSVEPGVPCEPKLRTWLTDCGAKNIQRELGNTLRLFNPRDVVTLKRLDAVSRVVLQALKDNDAAVNRFDLELFDLKHVSHAKLIDLVLQQLLY